MQNISPGSGMEPGPLRGILTFRPRRQKKKTPFHIQGAPKRNVKRAPTGERPGYISSNWNRKKFHVIFCIIQKVVSKKNSIRLVVNRFYFNRYLKTSAISFTRTWWRTTVSANFIFFSIFFHMALNIYFVYHNVLYLAWVLFKYS